MVCRRNLATLLLGGKNVDSFSKPFGWDLSGNWAKHFSFTWQPCLLYTSHTCTYFTYLVAVHKITIHLFKLSDQATQICRLGYWLDHTINHLVWYVLGLAGSRTAPTVLQHVFNLTNVNGLAVPTWSRPKHLHHGKNVRNNMHYN